MEKKTSNLMDGALGWTFLPKSLDRGALDDIIRGDKRTYVNTHELVHKKTEYETNTDTANMLDRTFLHYRFDFLNTPSTSNENEDYKLDFRFEPFSYHHY